MSSFPYGRITHHLAAVQHLLVTHPPRSAEEQRHHAELSLTVATLIYAVRQLHHRSRHWRGHHSEPPHAPDNAEPAQ